MNVSLEPGPECRTGGCYRSKLATKFRSLPAWGTAVSDMPAETPRIARAYCPACEPDADTLLEILEVQWCNVHMPMREGLDDGYESALKKEYDIDSFDDLQQRWQRHAFGG